MSVPIVTNRGIEDGRGPEHPPHGSFVLHCGHMLHPKRHFLFTPVAMIYHANGTERKTHWAVVCENCRQQAGGNFHAVKLKGVGQYAHPGMPTPAAPVKPGVHPTGQSMTISINADAPENNPNVESGDNSGSKS